ncbi:Pkinase-domain-containing protein [Lichtheimia hyalospora FSU 10163]|nr:Pkinase-domain-containing protein [Lichtheimia hyalospora FSU 10163]
MVQGTAVETSDRANHPLDAGHGAATANGSALLHSVIQSNDAAGSSSNNNTTPPQQPPPPVTSTDVDDPSHPLFRHRRTVTDFDYGPVLGEGSYSTVLVGNDKKTGKQYAIKKLDKAHIVKNDKVKYVMIERDALSKMNHPGIVRLYWTFKDNRSLYYVIDLARNGELYTYIRRLAPFDMDTTRFYAAEILLAIEHIHSRNIVHRDIKPENILLDDRMHIKITDFGSAKILQPEKTSNENEHGEEDGNGTSKTRSRSFVGTAEYVSPELLRSDPTLQEADLWALGCVIYQMLAGRSPFKASTDYLIFQKVKNLDYSIPDDFDQVAKDLVTKLLVLEPEQRLGSEATGGMDALKAHPFFDGIDWDHIWESQAPPLKERLDAKLKRTRATAEAAAATVVDNDDIWFGDEGHMIPSLTTQVVPQQQQQQQSFKDPFSDEAAARVEDDDDSAHGPFSQTPHPPTAAAAAAVRQRHTSGDQGATSTTSSGVAGGHHPSASTSSTLDRLGEQSHPPWMPHLYPNESIIRCGRLIRRRGLFNKKRVLILTDRPRLLYLDEGPEKDGAGGALRCEIPWIPQLLAELKTKSVFCIHTPQKSYTLEDSNAQAQEWVNTINSMLVDSFGVAA